MVASASTTDSRITARPLIRRPGSQVLTARTNPTSARSALDAALGSAIAAGSTPPIVTAVMMPISSFRFDPANVPWATFTSPEVGRVGLTEAEAAEAHPKARIAHLPLEHVDRAVAVGAERGFVKLIAAPKHGIGHLGGGRLVGATIVAPTGGDVVHEAALAMQTNMFVGRLAQTTHAYPTWAMAVQHAALQFFGPSAGLRARPGVLSRLSEAQPRGIGTAPGSRCSTR